MKKIIVTLAAIGVAAASVAAPVSADRAKLTAASYFKGITGRTATVASVVSQTDSYYIMNMAGGGWVIVSSDDIATPVLGYSTTGKLDWSRMPDNMRGMLGVYTKEMKAIKGAGITRQNAAWKEVSRPMSGMSRAGAAVEPLISVNWDQSAPYNAYCPGTGNNKAIVGCVAVAMSQAMSVQRYPLQPQGNHSYGCAGYGTLSVNYDTERSYDWDAIISGANNFDDAARLMYHAGVSVDMGYGAEGSGIPSNRVDLIPHALSTYFGYSASDLRYHWRENYSGDWENLVLNELSAGRAVVYNAVDTRGNYGHSFNIDGYNGASMFHVNWGWGGYGNGYFTLDRLTDASMNMNYDAGHVVVIGIGSPNQVLKSIDLSDIVIDEKLPVGTVVGQVSVNGTAPESSFQLEVFGPYNPQRNDYDAVPFRLDGDLLVTTEVLAARENPYEIYIRVIDRTTNTRLTSSFNITVCTLRTIAQATSMTFDRATGDLNIKTRNGLNYTLKSANGSTISSGNLSPVPHLTVNMSQLAAGDNILTLTDGSNTKTLTIKK